MASPLPYLIVIILLGVLAYSNTLESPFIMDDEINITVNPAMKDWSYFTDPSGYEEITRGELSRVFKTRIVGYFSFALNYRLGGLDTTSYHITNICIHILSALLLYRLVTLTFLTPAMQPSEPDVAQWTAFCAAALFVAHPLQSQAVTYIVQRFASMATLFYLACVVCYVQWRLAANQGWAARAYALTSFIFALLAVHTKEIAFTIPLALALYEFVFIPGKWQEKVRPLAPYFLLLILIPWILLRKGQGVSGEIGMASLVAHQMPHDVYALTELRVVATYLRLLVLPMGQNLDYDYALSRSFFEPSVLGASLLHAGLLSLAAYLLYRQKHSPSPWGRLCAFGIIWFYLTLFIESGAVPIADVIMEHRVYLPSVGALLVLACGLSLLWSRHRVAGTLALVIIVGLLAAGTYARNAVWATDVALWEDAASKSPGKARPFTNLGTAYEKIGQDENAEKAYKTSIAVEPSNDLGPYSLGMFYFRKERYLEAQILLREATQIDPMSMEAFYYLGNAFAQTGMYYEAIVSFKQALQLFPANAPAHSNLASAYMAIGQRDDAIREFREALRINPKYEKARTNLESALKLK